MFANFASVLKTLISAVTLVHKLNHWQAFRNFAKTKSPWLMELLKILWKTLENFRRYLEILSSLLTIRWIQLTLNIVNVLIASQFEQDAWCDLADPAHLSWGVELKCNIGKQLAQDQQSRMLIHYMQLYRQPNLYSRPTTAFDILRYLDVQCEDPRDCHNTPAPHHGIGSSVKSLWSLSPVHRKLAER